MLWWFFDHYWCNASTSNLWLFVYDKLVQFKLSISTKVITIQFRILKQLPPKPGYFIEIYYPPESSQTIFIGFRRQIRAKLHLHRSISTLPFQIQYTFSPSLSTHLYGPAAGLEVLLSRLDARLQVADVRAEPAPTAVRCSVLKKEKKTKHDWTITKIYFPSKFPRLDKLNLCWNSLN